MPEDTTAYEETMPTVDEDDLLQEDFTMARVPVEVVEAVTNYRLPNRRAQTGTDLVSDTSAVEILATSNKRAKVTLVSMDGPLFVSSGNSSFSAWPQNVPYIATHCASIK